jgi:hypothetical protein
VLCEVTNPLKCKRIFYDVAMRRIELKGGETTRVDLLEPAKSNLIVVAVASEKAVYAPTPPSAVLEARPTGAKVAVIVGGSERAMDDYAKACEWCKVAGAEPIVFVCNDMIGMFQDYAEYLVTLHPDKLLGWLNQRQKNGFPKAKYVWAHRRFKDLTTNDTADWGGSSGLLMVKIALEQGFKHIVLAGVPMDPTAKHFVRHLHWAACAAFRRAWERRKTEIAPYVRSMSGGWTEQQFGAPDAAWLAYNETKAA